MGGVAAPLALVDPDDATPPREGSLLISGCPAPPRICPGVLLFELAAALCSDGGPLPWCTGCERFLTNAGISSSPSLSLAPKESSESVRSRADGCGVEKRLKPPPLLPLLLVALCFVPGRLLLLLCTLPCDLFDCADPDLPIPIEGSILRGNRSSDTRSDHKQVDAHHSDCKQLAGFPVPTRQKRRRHSALLIQTVGTERMPPVSNISTSP